MTPEVGLILGMFAAVIILLFIFVVRVWVLTRRLNASFAKLGYVVREDAKKYFDDAADKIVDTNERFQHMYQQIVEDGTKKALEESGAATEKIIESAHAKANQVILAARTDAQRIVQEAQKEAEDRSEKTMHRTGDAIEWVMSQYLGERFSVEDHEALIDKQVKTYINEHRQ